MVGFELFKGSVKQGVLILQPVRLIDHQVRPRNRLQNIFVLQQDLVGGEQGVELGPLVARVDPLSRPNDGPARDVSNVRKDVHVGTPFAKLLLPGVKCGKGYYNQEGSVKRVFVKQVVEEGD